MSRGLLRNGPPESPTSSPSPVRGIRDLARRVRSRLEGLRRSFFRLFLRFNRRGSRPLVPLRYFVKLDLIPSFSRSIEVPFLESVLVPGTSGARRAQTGT